MGVDADSGLVHTVVVITAEVADGVMSDALLHGEERVVLGDRAYTRKDRNLESERQEGEPVWAFPFKPKKGEDLPAEQALHNRLLAALQAVVEHPLRMIKCQFGYTKARYRGTLQKRAAALSAACPRQSLPGAGA